MKIKQVKVIQHNDSAWQTFSFNSVGNGVPCLYNGANLASYLRFCFGSDDVDVQQVNVTVEIDNQDYLLTRWREGSSVYAELTANSITLAEDDDAIDYLNDLAPCKLLDLVSTTFDRGDYQSFNGSLKGMPAISPLLKVIENASNSVVALTKQRDAVNSSAKTLMSATPKIVSKKVVDELATKLAEINAEIDTLSEKEVELQLKGKSKGANENILVQLRQAQIRYDELMMQADEMELDREELTKLVKLKDIMPKVNRMRSLEKQQSDVDLQRHKLVAELEWQEKELADVVSRIDITSYNVVTASDKRNVLTSVNHEVEVINKLTSQNEQYTIQLDEAKKKLQQLSYERVAIRNKLLAIESSISDTNKAIEQFQQSGQSINDLMELARIQAQIDELSSQISQVSEEVSKTEKLIAERESNQIVIAKNYKQVVELDSSVSSIKAKDTILQVLDAKYNKLSTINSNFKQKQRNLQRVLEDYNYQSIEIDNSVELLNKRLSAEREKLGDRTNFQLYGKQDVTAIQALVNELDSRNAMRLSLIKKSGKVEGKLEEVERFIAINSADMAMLEQEKANILSRYNEITSIGRNEPAYQYVKALETNNGTNYLLDIHRSSVAVEMEIDQAKKQLNSNRNKLSTLKSRLAQAENHKLKQMEECGYTVVMSNDALRNELADLGQRISDGFTAQQELSNNQEEIDTQLAQVKTNVYELTKNIEVNENRIQLARDNIASYAGDENADKVIDELHYELADIDSERNILVENRREIERKVFDKKLQLEKLAYVSSAKATELETLSEDVKRDVSVANIDLDKIDISGYKAKIDKLTRKLDEYDNARQVLAHRIDNYSAVLVIDTQGDQDLLDYVEQLGEVQHKLSDLKQERATLQHQHKEKLLQYLSNGDTRMQFAVVATEAQSLPALSQAIDNSQIAQMLMTDKVNGILARATTILTQAISEQYTLTLNSGDLAIEYNGELVEYRNMPVKHQWALYLSLVMAMPSKNKQNEKWLTLDASVPYNANELHEMLKHLGGKINYVTNYKQERNTNALPTT